MTHPPTLPRPAWVPAIPLSKKRPCPSHPLYCNRRDGTMIAPWMEKKIGRVVFVVCGICGKYYGRKPPSKNRIDAPDSLCHKRATDPAVVELF